jgi:hypothetical protein
MIPIFRISEKSLTITLILATPNKEEKKNK